MLPELLKGSPTLILSWGISSKPNLVSFTFFKPSFFKPHALKTAQDRASIIDLGWWR